MNKKLKIQFWKAEKALAMQILEQEGNFRDSEHVLMGLPELCCDGIFLCDEEERGNLDIPRRHFDTNAERDEYLNNVIRWISEEQFAIGGKLEIGKECKASNDGENWRVRIFAGKLAKQLGEPRNLVAYDEVLEDFERYKYVRPLASFVQPKIDSDVYTWEEK